MRPRHILLAALVVGVVATGAMAAVVQRTFEVTLEQDPAAIEQGKPFSGVLLLTASRSTRVDNLDLASPGWRVEVLDPPPGQTMQPGETWPISFTATPLTDDAPLLLHLQTDDGPVTMDLGLSPAHARRTRSHPAMATGRGGPAAATPAAKGAAGAFLEAALRQRRAELPSPQPDKGTLRDVRIHGGVTYRRTDGVRLGAYGLLVEVRDRDLIGSNELGVGICRPDGSFDFTVTFNETALDRDPDLEVRFVADPGWVRIRPTGALSSSYSWSAGPWNNFGGTDLDLGNMLPPTAEDDAVLHILNNLTRAAAGLWAEGRGMVPEVTVVYPDDVWPNYDPYFERIHIPRFFDDDPADPNNDLIDFQWRENVQIHEFGHHVMNMWGEIGPIEYCNNTCDIGQCGHCLYCSETPEVAWSEGWSDWFSEYWTSQFPTSLRGYGLHGLRIRAQPDLRLRSRGQLGAARVLVWRLGYRGVLRHASARHRGPHRHRRAGSDIPPAAARGA